MVVALLGLGVWLTPGRAAAEPAADAPSVEPSYVQRVAPQRPGDPFALSTLGLEFGSLLPRGKLLLPKASGGTLATGRPALSQLAVQVGGLHFFGHADIYVNIPVYGLSKTLGAGADAGATSATYLDAAGLHYYPWALRGGTLRPFLAVAATIRRYRFADAEDPRARAGLDQRIVLPLGVGAGLRLDPVLIDVTVDYTLFDQVETRGGQVVTPLREAEVAMPAERFNLNGLRVMLGIKGTYDTTPNIIEPGFRQREAALVQQRARDGTASAINVALGPSTRLVGNNSDYEDRRPYLRFGQDDYIFPHAAIGAYHYAWDAELRLAYRSIFGGAEAYGARLETAQHVGFLEALKFFEIGLYGFVPFVGLGAGFGHFLVRDTVGADTTRAAESRAVLSVPIGWDIRIRPSSSWLLRTNLRWIPQARVDLVPGTHYDFGGLEFDIIQFVLFPARL